MTEEKSFPYFLLVLAGLASQAMATAAMLYLVMQFFPPPRLGNFDDLRYFLEPAWSMLGIMLIFLVLAIMRKGHIRDLTILAILLQLVIIVVLRFWVWI